jgi:hypothetical protein
MLSGIGTSAAVSVADSGARIWGVLRRKLEEIHFRAVSPLGLGVTFRVLHGRGRPKITWSYDLGVTETAGISTIVHRAMAEIETALGYPPGDEFTAERPASMGSFTWTPSLPTRPRTSKSRNRDGVGVRSDGRPRRSAARTFIVTPTRRGTETH